jgi:hypothetical protein
MSLTNRSDYLLDLICRTSKHKFKLNKCRKCHDDKLIVEG